MRKWMFLTLALTFASASAQGDLPGLPADWQPVVTLAIGLLSGVLVGPLTAIAKKLGRTEGPNTVAVSAVMSLLVTLGFSLWQATASQTNMPWGQALLLALIAFVKSNGDYISRVFSTAKGQGTPEVTVNMPTPEQPPTPAPIVIGDVMPPADIKTPPPGAPASDIEPIPGLDTAPLGLLSSLPPQVVEQGIEVVISQMLAQAGLQATPQQLVRVAARLAVVTPDLMDGNAYLSAENRNRILGVILDLKAGGDL
ncbi:hypothetical protein ACINK0_11395 [Deinococcus sp. VB343]|uniref:hypothetical protein n=1 Tax=Deinococcus sp. VB343 TaxID=3385567 RepID=UPI0039C9087A